MNRRSLLLGAGAVGLTAAVGGAAIAVAAPEDTEAGRRSQPLLTWELTGGFVPAGWNALRAPRLVAYDDGTLVADAARRVKVGQGTLRSLRNHATAVLRDPANTRRRPGAPMIADVPSTVFTVRGNGRRFRAQFEGLEETRADRAYPAAAYSLLDHLSQLRDRTLRTGSPFHPDAVRLVAVLLDPAQRPTVVAPWPAGVPVPQLDRDEFVAQLDLRGRQARALLRAVPHPDPAQWPVLATADGRRFQVNHRFLLPHE
ncbi:hypothetical protein Daura_11630 [Dactylosporangium aurantiacum]|uniref:Uncharacterized protein n=1 Tax=Dactylosporangium aurantiacum TaxID=35754 RepID=A0A9Q9IP84_9ACTN|nr:hypothetical protein [Dactylosporangium aurantiacum]MDG6104240.1 hypothetical protein [Dactylosporangium aurantiacum]UWZ56760.1 hypothetical protein Daura_11630 [Dactylosporangium aurantiacum]